MTEAAKKTPLPVEVANAEPLAVTVAAVTAPPSVLVTSGQGTTLAPTTTEEHDRVTKGQRDISRVWEYVQAGIAFSVTSTTLWVLASLALRPQEPSTNQLQVIGHLMVMTTMILTFYYQRTNHSNIGGVGPKTTDKYEGR